MSKAKKKDEHFLVCQSGPELMHDLLGLLLVSGRGIIGSTKEGRRVFQVDGHPAEHSATIKPIASEF